MKSYINPATSFTADEHEQCSVTMRPMEKSM
jgi:hypothetical protein